MAAYTKSGKLQTVGGKAAIDVDCCSCGIVCGPCVGCKTGDIPTTAVLTIDGWVSNTPGACDCSSLNGTFLIPLTPSNPCVIGGVTYYINYEGTIAIPDVVCGSVATPAQAKVSISIFAGADTGTQCVASTIHWGETRLSQYTPVGGATYGEQYMQVYRDLIYSSPYSGPFCKNPIATTGAGGFFASPGFRRCRFGPASSPPTTATGSLTFL